MTRIVLLLIIASLAAPAHAYIGPGAGISVLGSLLGIIAAVFVAIFAIVAWPVRRMLKKRKQRANEITAETPRPEVSGEQSD